MYWPRPHTAEFAWAIQHLFFKAKVFKKVWWNRMERLEQKKQLDWSPSPDSPLFSGKPATQESQSKSDVKNPKRIDATAEIQNFK